MGRVKKKQRKKRHAFAVLLHNDSLYLKECLDSLVAQSEHSEIYLCTSTSSRFQRSIASQYGLRLVVNPKRRGLAADWNFALRQPSTRYVTLAHQDDVYEPSYARAVCDAMDRYTDPLIAFSNYGELRGTSFVCKSLLLRIKRLLLTPMKLARNHLTPVWMKKLMLTFGNPIACPAVTYNRTLLSAFSFSGDYTINVDWDAWLRLSEMHGAFVRVDAVLLWHRIYPGSETSSGLATNRRQCEDKSIYMRTLPPGLSFIFRTLYSFSYRFNK